MCGSVILFAGVFLFIMNIYNYHMLKKENSTKNSGQIQKNTEIQVQVEMKQTTEAAMEQSEPEVSEKPREVQDQKTEKQQN